MMAWCGSGAGGTASRSPSARSTRRFGCRRWRSAPDEQTLAIGTESRGVAVVAGGSDAGASARYRAGGGGQILRFTADGRFLLTGNRVAGLELVESGDGGAGVAAAGDAGRQRLGGVLAGWQPLADDGAGRAGVALESGSADQRYGRAVADRRGADHILAVDWTDDGVLLLFFDAVGPVYLWGVG